MEKHNIDKLFSDKLAGHAPTFNPAHWSQMEGVIQTQGNSGSLLWWMIGAGLTVLTIVGLSSNHYLRASEGHTLQSESTSISHEAIVFKVSHENEDQFLAWTESPAASGSHAKSVDEQLSSAIQQNDASIQSDQVTKNNTYQNNDSKKKEGSLGLANSDRNEEQTTTKTDRSLNAEVNTPAQEQPEKRNTDKTVGVVSSSDAVDDTVRENAKSKEKITDINTGVQNSNRLPIHTVSIVKQNPNFGFSQTGNRQSNLGGAGLNMLPAIRPKADFANPFEKPGLWNPESRSLPPVDPFKPYKWVLAASAGMHASSKLIESNYDFLNPFIDKRNSDEQSTVTPSFGLELSFAPNRFSFSTGLHFNSVSYEANYSPFETQVIDSVVDNSYYDISYWQDMVIDTIWSVDSTGGGNGVFFELDTLYFTVIDSVLVASFDTTFTSQLQQFQQGLITTYQYLEIPIHVGYTFPLGNRGTHLGVHGGVSLTYLRSTTGAYINQGLTELQLVQKKETAVGLDLIARLRLSQGIGYRMSVFAEGRYRHGLGSVSTSADYTEKHRMYGGAIGLMYKF